MSACPECRYFGAEVVETKKLHNGWVRRNRACSCGHKWRTFEIPNCELEMSPNENLKEIKIRKKKEET